jgi:hypothetical protein
MMHFNSGAVDRLVVMRGVECGLENVTVGKIKCKNPSMLFDNEATKQTKTSSTTKKRYTYVRLLHLVVIVGEGGGWKKVGTTISVLLDGGSSNVIVIRYYVPSFRTGRLGQGGPVGRSVGRQGRWRQSLVDLVNTLA